MPFDHAVARNMDINTDIYSYWYTRTYVHTPTFIHTYIYKCTTKCSLKHHQFIGPCRRAEPRRYFRPRIYIYNVYKCIYVYVICMKYRQSIGPCRRAKPRRYFRHRIAMCKKRCLLWKKKKWKICTVTIYMYKKRIPYKVFLCTCKWNIYIRVWFCTCKLYMYTRVWYIILALFSSQDRHLWGELSPVHYMSSQNIYKHGMHVYFRVSLSVHVNCTYM